MASYTQGTSIIVESLPTVTSEQPEVLSQRRCPVVSANDNAEPQWDPEACQWVDVCRDAWWTVSLSAREIVADTSGGGSVVPDNSTFQSQLANPRSSLVVFLTARTVYGSQTALLDLGGGGRWSVFGRSIDVSVAGSQARVVQAGQLSAVAPVTAWTQVIGHLAKSEFPVGDRQGRFTQRIVVPANGVVPQVRLPPWATDVQITEGTIAAQAPGNAEWIMLDRLRGATDRPGRIPLVLGLSPVISIPGYVTFFQVSAPAAFDRFYSFSYDVRFW